jgi:hypothetical protein
MRRLARRERRIALRQVPIRFAAEIDEPAVAWRVPDPATNAPYVAIAP